LIFRVESVNAPWGRVMKDGVEFDPGGEMLLRYGESLTWVPDPAATGRVNAFVISLVDGEPGLTAAVPIQIDPDPTAPDAADDTATIPANSENIPIDVLGNDADSSGQAGSPDLTVISVGVALHGRVTLSNGIVRYTPMAGFVGWDEFSYVVRQADGKTDLAEAQVNVQYNPEPTDQGFYAVTVLNAPPGWAGLPEEWGWEYTSSLPDWDDTFAIDITDDGWVLVGTWRNVGDKSNLRRDA
jgi:hypothetical protein